MKVNSIIPKAIILIFSSMLIINTIHSQILISLLLGDKLNTGKIEFGLEGGFNRSYLGGISGTKGYNNFNLGFYFDIKIKNNWYLNTGVRVKSNMGATNLLPYSLNDRELDTVFEDGHVTRKLGYFYVPVQIKYRFVKQFYVNGGFQAGLRNNAKDLFYNSVENEDDIVYTNQIKDRITLLDVGVLAGAGYKFRGQGMNLGIVYYQGLVNVIKNDNAKSLNSTFYIYLDIPIGAGKKVEKSKE